MSETIAKNKPEDLDSFMKPNLSDRSLRWFKNLFEEVFDGDDWKDFEAEFLLMELAEQVKGPLPIEVIKKIMLLKALEDDPERFYTDPLFMLHAVEIINSTSHTNPKDIPSVTSLELAYAVNLIGNMYPQDATPELKGVCEYVLKEEGFTNAPYPFTFVDDNRLPETELKKDEERKARAIRAYLRLMEMKDK